MEEVNRSLEQIHGLEVIAREYSTAEEIVENVSGVEITMTEIPEILEDGKKSKSHRRKKDFVKALREIVDNVDYDNAIRWGDSGKFIEVIDSHRFTKLVPPSFFSGRYDSFTKKLEEFGFTRVETREHCYCHPQFIRDSPDLMVNIKSKREERRNTTKAARETQIVLLLKEIKEAIYKVGEDVVGTVRFLQQSNSGPSHT